MPETWRTSVIELDDANWSRLTDALYGFEEAWKAAPFPNLEPFVPPVSDPLRKQTLVELVKVDQERRALSGQPQLLEAYLADWPELSTDEDATAELLEAECGTRATLGDTPTASELHARFPSVSDRVDFVRIAVESRLEGSRPSAELAVGTRLDRYVIQKRIANKGMSTVYRASDTLLDRPVALKVPRFDPCTERDVIVRFLKEAKLAAKIPHHPNVCPIYDAGEIDGIDYIAMAFVEGQTLEDRLKDQPTTSASHAAKLVLKLSRALESVHAAGVIHRDIKPSNVMINSHGEPILMDFGLARQANDVQLAGAPGGHSGTPAYMPPEQVHGGAIDARSDIYSLGVVLYQLLTGRLPFTGDREKVLASIVTQVPTPPRYHQPKLDAVLQDICLKAMAKLPADRYQSAKEFADALDHALSKPQFQRWPLVAAGLVLAAVTWHNVANSRREPPNVADSLRDPDSNSAGSRQEPHPAPGEREPRLPRPSHLTNWTNPDQYPTEPWPLTFNANAQLAYEGELSDDQVQWYRVQTVQAGWLVVEALTLHDETNTGLRLHDAEFRQIAQDGNAGPGKDALLSHQVQKDETYHIAVYEDNGRHGPFRLIVTQPKEPPPLPPELGRKRSLIDVYGNDPSTAHQLTFHSTGHAFVVGSIRPIGDEDWFAFTAPATGTLLIKPETPHSSLDTFIQLFRAETNAQVAEDRSRIVFHVTAGERFRLRMKANDPLKDSGFDATGNYVLRLRQLEE